MLKLQYFGPLMRRANSLEKKDPDAGKDWGQEEKRAVEDEMLDSITDSMDMSLSRLWEIVEDRGAGMLLSMGFQRVGHNLATERR